MLCSISTGKSGATSWLDRLRTSKGFPSGDDLDLEQFLNRPTPNLSDYSDTNVSNSTSNCNRIQLEERPVLDRKQTAEIRDENGEKLFGVMSNVLEELFNMGESNDFQRINGKRSTRKQPNPRICVLANVDDERCSGDAARREEEGGSGSATLRSSGDHSCMEMMIKQRSDQTTKQKKNLHPHDGSVCMEEEEKSHSDLSAFSRIQVTVIDTSCPNWKIEKLLFRRKNVWKVRDKKCQTVNVVKKKRKAAPLDGEKEPKHSMGKCSSSTNGANGKEFVVPSNEGQRKSDKREEAHKHKLNILSQVSKKRFPRKSEKADSSSVVLIKSIPTSRKLEANNPKNLKLTQRQHKV